VSATLVAQVDKIGEAVRRVRLRAEELACAAVDLSELWDHDTVHETARASFVVRDSAAEVASALARLEEVAR
jgi:hypothetical protein